MDKQINFYLGKENATGFTGYLTENNFFLIIEIDQDYEKEKGNNLIFDIKQKLNSQTLINLQQFEDFIQKIIIDNNLPTHFSLAAVFFKDNIIYLKTINEGKIFCKRNQRVAEIISGNQSASGYVKFNDVFVLTTKKFIDKLEEAKEINRFLSYKTPPEIIEAITPILKNNDDRGLISLFIQIRKEETEETDSYYPRKSFLSQLSQLKRVFDMNFINTNLNSKKAITYFVLVIIFLIFIWSVVLGYQRRREKEVNTKIEKTEKEILNKLSQAEEISFLNLNQAKNLIEEANVQLNNLKKEIKKKNTKIDQIEKIIVEKENQIIKKETKNYQEFYDLSLDRKEASGDKFFLENDFLFILDKKGGVIFKLSLEKKSLDKFTNEKIKKAAMISSYGGKIYFFVGNDGIYQVDESGKIKKIIDNDKDWGEINDMSTYNGNIYLLDIKKDEVYKYLPTDNGFSEKNSYFKKGEAIDLIDAHSLTIDGSLYISFSKSIQKFTSGIKESFKNNFPNDNLQIEKAYTNKEISKIYAWDKKNGLIYVLTKDGEYQEQISSNIAQLADDFVVYNDKLFFLNKNKIYFIE
jgi:hypothetical protein